MKILILSLMMSSMLYGSEASEDWIWITIGADALPALESTFSGSEALNIQAVDETRGIAVLYLPEPLTAEISTLMHQRFHRCGGFMVHESYEHALQAATVAPVEPRGEVEYTIDNQEVVNTMGHDADPLAIQDTISNLAQFHTRFYNSDTGVEAAEWLRDYWIDLAGERTDVEVSLISHTWAQPSVMLKIRGEIRPEQEVVLGAHLDSTVGNANPGRSPGADDDASGIAVLTEVISVLMKRDFRPARTITFFGYAAEEVGLRGSAAIALDYRARNVDVVGVLQLDMTNFRGSSSDILLIADHTNPSQNTWLSILMSVYMPEISRSSTACGYACSDHASWNAQGYAASFPFESRYGEHNPNIHTSADTLENTGGNAEHAARFANLSLIYVAELAKGGFGPQVQPFPVDVTTLLRAASQPECPAFPALCELDVNDDGSVDINDMNTLLCHWHSTIDPTQTKLECP